jgi:beta-phosphoglucomutase-like phosphatase (HAD superfamily)
LHHLDGKPDPEIFLTAAHELGVEPRHAIVTEDASAGVQAAKAGGIAAIDTAALTEGRLAARKAWCRTARHAAVGAAPSGGSRRLPTR